MMLQAASKSVCCDCDCPQLTHVSLNNGVFLCENCAEIHRDFGEQCSAIKPLVSDDWDDTSFLCMRFGSNSKFQNFLSAYSLTNETPLKRYKSCAAQYYRKRLEAIAKGVPFNETAPGVEEGREMLEASTEQQMYDEEEKKAALDTTAGKLGIQAAKAGTFLYDKGKVAVDFIADKGGFIIENPTVQSVAQTAKRGVLKVTDIIGAFFGNFASGFKNERRREEAGSDSI
eukprot:TRINITY_DN1341_c0_g1_i3.p1 TRINITY_DN1341_c0_g1~~TRINITY_DN1341_c0_g1_i3.p1  ORF type:complete len:268 (-),score=79.27 TRINITY_DN1341_c0_g1_i3:98-784(-)